MVTTIAPVIANAPDDASVNGETDGSAITAGFGAPQLMATATAAAASHPRTDVRRVTRASVCELPPRHNASGSARRGRCRGAPARRGERERRRPGPGHAHRRGVADRAGA